MHANAPVGHITDDFMRSQLPTAKTYSILILKRGPRFGAEGTEATIWEHGRRNFGLRADGRLSIVCPVNDGSELCGVGIFNLTVAQTEELMDDDPGVRAGLFVFEVHASRGFPGDSLPG